MLHCVTSKNHYMNIMCSQKPLKNLRYANQNSKGSVTRTIVWRLRACIWKRNCHKKRRVLGWRLLLALSRNWLGSLEAIPEMEMNRSSKVMENMWVCFIILDFEKRLHNFLRNIHFLYTTDTKMFWLRADSLMGTFFLVCFQNSWSNLQCHCWSRS